MECNIFQMLASNGGGGGDMKDCGFNQKYEDGHCKTCPKCPIGHGLPGVSISIHTEIIKTFLFKFRGEE